MITGNYIFARNINNTNETGIINIVAKRVVRICDEKTSVRIIKKLLREAGIYEAQIEVNEMIIKDYQEDKLFVAGLQRQIDQWNERILKIEN